MMELDEFLEVSTLLDYYNIKRGIKLLKDYEERLGFHEREKQIYQELLELKKDFKIEKLDTIIEKLF